MAVILWPSADVPETQAIGVKDWKDEALIKSQMDNGSFKARRRTRLPRRFISWKWELSGQERKDLETFYDTTLQNGALAFNMEDPLEESVLAWRFTSRPTFTMVLGASETNWALRRWSNTIALENTGPELV